MRNSQPNVKGGFEVKFGSINYSGVRSFVIFEEIIQNDTRTVIKNSESNIAVGRVNNFFRAERTFKLGR